MTKERLRKALANSRRNILGLGAAASGLTCRRKRIGRVPIPQISNSASTAAPTDHP